MKKILYISAIAAIALTACSTDEKGELSREIPLSFSAYSGRSATKAKELVTSANFNGTFGVYGYNNANVTWTNANKAEFMDDAKVDYTPNAKVGSVDQPKYWPKSGERNLLSFIAYYPHSSVANSGVMAPSTPVGYPVFNFTVNPDPSKQVDFMVSDLVKNNWVSKSYNANITVTPSNDRSADKTVPFVFGHKLCRIAIKAAAKSATPKITVKKVVFSGLKNSGTLKNEGGVYAWKDLTGNVSYNVYNDNTGTELATTAVQLGSDANVLLLIPQTLSADTKVQFVYHVEGENGDFTSEPTTLAPAGASVTSWGINQSIVYNFKLGLDEILFSASVTAWATEQNQGFDN